MKNMETRTGNLKGEKHVPVIDVEEREQERYVKVSVGKEIPHPNTPEHYIGWIELYFKAEGREFPVMVDKAAFAV